MLKDTNSTCPSILELQRWVDGSLESERAEQVGEHFAACSQCEAKLNQLTDDPELRSMLYLLPLSASVPIQWQSPSPSTAANDAATHLDSVRDEGAVRGTTDIPQAIDNYVLGQQLGEGTFARVFSAWDSTLNRSVAVKCLKPERSNGRVIERFIREARALAGVDSENVIRIIRAPSQSDSMPYLVMELVEGGTLLDWLDSHAQGSFPDKHSIKKAAAMVRDAASGLCSVHDAKLVHRDVKPSNILVAEDRKIAKLADFGLAQDDRLGTLTQTAEMIGTPVYMSPEQAEAQPVDSRTDIYSLGATLYQLITGQSPFQGTTPVILRQIVEREPIRPSQLNPHVSTELECVCMKAMQKHPAERYQSAYDFRDDLNRWLEGRPVAARPLSAFGRAAKWYRRNLPFAIAMTLLAGALLAGTATTTWLWLTNAKNARLATTAAEDLRINRAELRSTVSRFQERIYSDQGLHWQLAPTFRRNMFRDFLSYLDKFAEIAADSSEKEDWTAELARDYLMIAESALLVRDFEISKAAADRTLDQISQSKVPSLETLLNQSRAAEVAFWCTAEQETRDRESLEQYAQQSRTAVEQAQNLAEHPDEVAPQLFRARFLRLKLDRSNTIPLEQALQLAEEIRDFPSISKLHPTNTNRLEVLPTAVRVGWFIVEDFPDANELEVLQETETAIAQLREATRVLQKPLYTCDYFQANNKTKMALVYADQGSLDQAIEAAESSMVFYQRALTDSPYNFPWRHQSAMLRARLGDWLIAENLLGRANQHFHQAVTEFVSILRNDPLDNEIRFDVIRMMTKKATLSAKLEQHDTAGREFYMAAQDFRHFLAAEEYRDTHNTFHSARLWLLAKALQHSGLAENLEYHETIQQVERNYIAWLKPNRPDLDNDQHSAVIDGEASDRPMPEFLVFRHLDL